MRRIAILLTLAACLVGLGSGGGNEPPASGSTPQPLRSSGVSKWLAAQGDPTPATCDGKSAAFHKHRAHAIIDKGYAPSRWQDRSPLTDQERKSLQEHKFCLRRSEAREAIAKYRAAKADEFRSERRTRLQAQRLTPYDCGSNGDWAIPCEIVDCESNYSWTAYNPSGARGPYQLLDKGDPWPVDSEADKLAHHRIASDLYAGGAGRSHWVC